jgi:hypothetical protein
MSIRITDTSNPLVWQYVHDDAHEVHGGPHGGDIDPATVVHWTDPVTGLVDYDTVHVPCPYSGCGSASWHPAGGGADPVGVQELFVRLSIRDRGMSPQVAIGDVRARCERMDGVGRWQVNEAELLSRL